MADINSVWATTVTRFEIQLETMTLVLHLRAIDCGEESLFVMLLRGFSELRLTNGIRLPWVYAELTEAHAEGRADGSWEVELILWDEDCTLTCICAGFSVEDLPSTPV
ncbi:hypothetical protein [Nocardioides ultimimeridianus]